MPNDLVIIGARPATGKTTLMTTFTKNAILNKSKVMLFTLEMKNTEIISKLVSSATGVPTLAMRNGSLTEGQATLLMDKHHDVTKAHKYLHLNDDRSVTMQAIRTEAILQKNKTGLDILMVDYLQIVQPTDKRMPREQQVSEVARGLKALAKELNIPVIALAQVNRDSDKKSTPPKMSDLRESGSIEQEADAIILLHRDKGQFSDVTKLIIAKIDMVKLARLRLNLGQPEAIL